jgi:hypothetical protein
LLVSPRYIYFREKKNLVVLLPHALLFVLCLLFSYVYIFSFVADDEDEDPDIDHRRVVVSSEDEAPISPLPAGKHFNNSYKLCAA